MGGNTNLGTYEPAYNIELVTLANDGLKRSISAIRAQRCQTSDVICGRCGFPMFDHEHLVRRTVRSFRTADLTPIATLSDEVLHAVCFYGGRPMTMHREPSC